MLSHMHFKITNLKLIDEAGHMDKEVVHPH